MIIKSEYKYDFTIKKTGYRIPVNFERHDRVKI